MSTHRIGSIYSFEDFAISAQTPSQMDFYLRHSLSINEPYVECRECIVYHNGDLTTFISRFHAELPFTQQRINPNIPAYRIARKNVNKKASIEGTVVILDTSANHLFRIITISRSEFWKDVVIPFLRKMYPHVSIVYFRQLELEQALLDFEKNLKLRFSDKVKVSVVEVTRKSERTLKPNQKEKFLSTERSWTNLALNEVFSELKERGFWFTNLKYKVSISNLSKRVLKNSIGKVYKFGSFSCTSMYDELQSYLIGPLEKLVAKRMRLLEGRGIIERDYQPGPPLEIKYENDVFDSKEKVRQFGETIRRYSNASIVVYHGNPYFHANIADLRDGSSFEIWVLSQCRILISPQATSSAQALSRVIAFIFDQFKEGVVSEYVPGTE